MGLKISRTVKILYTILVVCLLPVSIDTYGWMNLLWFSNLGLIGTVPALWLENRTLMGMTALSVCLLDSLWTLDWAVAVTFGVHPIGGTQYMFDDSLLLQVRNFSLYHLVLPPLLVYGVARLGYDRRCLIRQTVFAWTVLWLVFLFGEREANINWVFGPVTAQSVLHPWFYFSMVLVAVPVVVYLPFHLLLARFFSSAPHDDLLPGTESLLHADEMVARSHKIK